MSDLSKLSERSDWGIIYLRPDGWWSACDGLDSEDDALECAEAHDWRGSKWRVVPVKHYPDILCPEAMEDFNG